MNKTYVDIKIRKNGVKLCLSLCTVSVRFHVRRWKALHVAQDALSLPLRARVEDFQPDLSVFDAVTSVVKGVG